MLGKNKKKFKVDIETLDQKADAMINSLAGDVAILKQDSDDCLSIFNDTIVKLSNTNEKMDAKIASIEGHVAALNSYKDVISRKRDANAAIKSKIENLLA